MKFLRILFILCITNLTAAPSAFPAVDELNPETLRLLDQPGEYSFATTIGAAEAERAYLEESKGDPGLKGLPLLRLHRFSQIGNPQFTALATRINLDVNELKKLSGEKMAYSSEQAELLGPQGNVARHFDPFWLSSARAAFPLVAVVNRMDKRDTNDGETCGELRFLYRLAYFKKEGSNESRSTLPVFMNVVYDYLPSAHDNCKSVAQAWNSPAAASPAERAAWLRKGALAKERLRFRQIELNMQIVRFPSGQKIDFGGQAIYLFRIFQNQNGQLLPVPLENTPDVALIQKSPSLKEALIQQLSDKAALEQIENGTFVLKNTEGKLLATRALSFSTSGRMRVANKPFTAIFGAEASPLANINLGALQLIKSRPALVERLNNLTCVGCHQSGGTAGFHLLGHTGNLNSAFNQVVLPFSPHYYAERARREAYVASLANGQAPNTFRPPSFFPAANWAAASGIPKFLPAQARELCLAGNSDFSSGLGCAAGSECRLTVQNSKAGLAIGECVLKTGNVAGHICRQGVITTAASDASLGDLYNLRSFRDSINIDKVISASGLACGNPKGGVPLGRIAKSCESNSAEGRLEFVDRLQPGQKPPAEICAMRGGPQFDECARTKNPPECLANAKIVRALLDSCTEDSFCREDYICQRLPEDVSRLYSGAEKKKVEERVRKLGNLGVGFCVPNYFVFNMRSDGHIIPEGRR